MFLSDLCTRTGPVIVAGETRSRSRRSVKRSARFDFPSVEIVMHGDGISDSNGRLLSGPPWILDLRRWSVTVHGLLGYHSTHTPAVDRRADWPFHRFTCVGLLEAVVSRSSGIIS